MKEKNKIRYNDLSWEIKIPIIYGWVMTILFCIAFTIGFIQG